MQAAAQHSVVVQNGGSSAQRAALQAILTTISNVRDEAADEDRSLWRKTPNGTELVPMGGPSASRYDFNYVRFNCKPSDLASQLASDMRETGSGGGRSLNAEQVLAELRALEKVEIRSAPFVQNEQFGAEGADGAYPVRRDDSAPRRAFSAVRFDERTSAVFVFAGLLFCEQRSPFEAVLAECVDRHTPVATYLAGTQHKPTTPHLYGVYRIGPHPQRRLEFRMPSSVKNRFASALFGKERLVLRRADAARANAPPWMRSDTFLITEPIDEFATRYRLHAISLPYDCPTLVARYLPRGTDMLVRQRGTVWCQLAEPDSMWRYPTDAEVTLPAHQRADQFLRATCDKDDAELLRDPEYCRRVTRRADVRAPAERKRVRAFGDAMLVALHDAVCRDADAQDRALVAAQHDEVEQARKRARIAVPAVDNDADDFAALFNGDDDADESHERRLADVADLEVDGVEQESARAAAEAREAEEREREFGAASETANGAESAYEADDYSYWMEALN